MTVSAFNEFIVPVLLRLSWRVLIVAALVWLLIKLFRIRNTRVLHFAWAAVLIGMLLFPVVFLFVPYIQIALLPVAPRLSAASEGLYFWVQTAAAIYFVGAAAMLARLATGLLSIKKLIRDSRIINSPQLNCRLKEIGQTGLKKLPVVLCSAAVKTPVTIGYFRPRIILPVGWRKWDDAKFRSVLAHEVAHIRRADYPLRILAFLNECVCWFHPLAWFVSRRLSLLSEKICDETAVRAGGDKREYARHLLEIAAADNGKKVSVERYGLAMAQRSRLKQRIEAVLDAEPQLTNRASRALTLFIALFVGVCWLAAGALCVGQ